jgi:SH3-like domain-containing protein
MKLFKMRNLLVLSLCCYTQLTVAIDYVSVSEPSAVLYDAPSTKGNKLFVVNRYMPFEQIVTLDQWVKVRDQSGSMYWAEKSALSSKRYVFATSPVIDVRAEPDFGASRLFQVRKDVALERIESAGTGWIQIRHQDGDVGYVRSTEVWGE